MRVWVTVMGTVRVTVMGVTAQAVQTLVVTVKPGGGAEAEPDSREAVPVVEHGTVTVWVIVLVV